MDRGVWRVIVHEVTKSSRLSMHVHVPSGQWIWEQDKVSYKNEEMVILCDAIIPVLGIPPKKGKQRLENILEHPRLQQHFIHNSWRLEITQVSIDRWTDKQSMVHIHTTEYFSVLERKETLMCQSMEEPQDTMLYGTHWPNKTYGHDRVGGQEGEGGMNGESSMETYTLTCVNR